MAGLVKLAVIRDARFGGKAEEAAAAEDGGAVIQRAAHRHGHARHCEDREIGRAGNQTGQLLLGRLQQGALEKEIAAGVAREAELGEYDGLHALRGGGADQGFHGAGVAAAIRHADHGGLRAAARKNPSFMQIYLLRKKKSEISSVLRRPPGPNGTFWIKLFSKSLRGGPEGQCLSGLRGAGRFFRENIQKSPAAQRKPGAARLLSHSKLYCLKDLLPYVIVILLQLARHLHNIRQIVRVGARAEPLREVEAQAAVQVFQVAHAALRAAGNQVHLERVKIAADARLAQQRAVALAILLKPAGLPPAGAAP